MKKTNVIPYVLRVWLTSVVLSPVLVDVYFGWKDDMPLDRELVPLMLLWGGTLSLPSLILLGISCSCLVSYKPDAKAVKRPLTAIAILLTYAPFWVLNNFSVMDNSGVTMFCIPYGLTIIAGIWFYNLKGVGRLDDNNVKE